MAEITMLLRAAASGDEHASRRVIGLLYEELHALARSRMRKSGAFTVLDTTALVNEAYLRLQRTANLGFADRQQFLVYAAKVMRTIVIDTVRARQAQRRGGQDAHVTLDTGVGDSAPVGEDELLRVHEALVELAAFDARLAQVVEMRYFGGFSEADIAECLGLTERTVQRDWRKARLFLAAAVK
jgi:RNA polymerase sigma factor (TIGR02999 family)